MEALRVVVPFDDAPISGRQYTLLQMEAVVDAWARDIAVEETQNGVVIGATAFGQIRLNAWNRPFYDALARKDLGDFLGQIMVFGVIAGGLLVLNVAQAWLNQTTKLRLRRGLVRDLFEEWLN